MAWGGTVMDTGCATPEILATWEELLAGPMRGGCDRQRRCHPRAMSITSACPACWSSVFDLADFIGTFAEWGLGRASVTPMTFLVLAPRTMPILSTTGFDVCGGSSGLVSSR